MLAGILQGDTELPADLAYDRLAGVMVERLLDFTEPLVSSNWDFDREEEGGCLLYYAAARQAVIALDVSPLPAPCALRQSSRTGRLGGTAHLSSQLCAMSLHICPALAAR